MPANPKSAGRQSRGRDLASELEAVCAERDALHTKIRDLQVKLDALRRAKAADTRVVKGSTVSSFDMFTYRIMAVVKWLWPVRRCVCVVATCGQLPRTLMVSIDELWWIHLRAAYSICVDGHDSS